jgi:serine/threonine-protein kinase
VAAEQSSTDFRGTLGRYALFGEIASGGMATVHVARLLGSVGFARTVAIKRLHPHLSTDPDFVAMFLEEARLAARVRHPNVVATLDVVDDAHELFLVMEYVAGESLSRLVRKTRDAGKRIPPRIVVAILCAALEGLHAAHEATSERGSPLGIVHRDVSPQNIHVGLDGVARVLDFGIAKATNRVQETRTDQIKGKVAYMSPEQLAKGQIDRRADVYSASVVLWEALTGARLFKADDVPSLLYAIMNEEVQPPSSIAPDLPLGLDEIVMKGLDREASNRWSSAREMAVALEKVLAPAPARDIGEWVREAAGDMLESRMELVHRIESETSTSIPPPLRKNSPMPIDIAASGVMRTPEKAISSDALPTEVDARIPEDERETIYRPAESFGAERTAALPMGSRIPFVPIAAALLLLGGVLLGIRLLQLRSDAPTTAPPAPSAEHEPAISLEVSRSASTATTTPTGAKGKPGTTAESTGAKPPANDCDPPYTIDLKGVRHPKVNCAKR